MLMARELSIYLPVCALSGGLDFAYFHDHICRAKMSRKNFPAQVIENINNKLFSSLPDHLLHRASK